MRLDQVVLERAGIVKGAVVAAHLSSWIACAHKLGKFPTVVEVAAFTGKTERQTWRWRATIREHFTEAEFRSVVMEAAAHFNRRDPVRVEVAA